MSTTLPGIERNDLGTPITDEMIALARRMIGVEYLVKPNCEVASRDAIRHWCYGIGDTNPLYLDEDYARGTRYGSIIAPPNFLIACGTGPMYPWDPRYEIRDEKRVRGSNFPGVGALAGGSESEHNRVIREGDVITGTACAKDVIEKKSSFSGRTIQTIGETVWRNQRSEIIAKTRGWGFRMERAAGRGGGKYKFEKYHYTTEELRNIADDYRKVEIRSATPRYWEDVKVGDDMGHLIKGPLTITTEFAFLLGWGGTLFGMGSKIAHDCLRDHPRAGIPDPDTNVVDFPERIHWDDVMARNVGVPAAFDMGPQRGAWFIQFLTNWMGDDGFLKFEHHEVRLPNILGDTQWFRGRITGKRIEDGEYLVDCEIRAENQRGMVTTPGRAVISLPSRTGAVPAQIGGQP